MKTKDRFSIRPLLGKRQPKHYTAFTSFCLGFGVWFVVWFGVLLYHSGVCSMYMGKTLHCSNQNVIKCKKCQESNTLLPFISSRSAKKLSAKMIKKKHKCDSFLNNRKVWKKILAMMIKSSNKKIMRQV